MRALHSEEPGFTFDATPLLEVDDLRTEAAAGTAGESEALRGVSFSLSSGETLGIVGEPGNGASEVIAVIAGLRPAWDGRVRIDGISVAGLDRHDMRDHRARIGVVVGNPLDPVDMIPPAMTVAQAVAEPLRIHRMCTRRECQDRAEETLAHVGLGPGYATALSADLTPVERVRVALARAVVLRPRLLLLDALVDRLPALGRRQVLTLLVRLRWELALTCLVSAAHPASVTEVSDRVMVMYAGRTVEVADRATLLDSPAHPYTLDLLSSVPLPDPARESRRSRPVIRPEAAPVPAEGDTPCAYLAACPRAQPRCASEAPPLSDRGLGHPVACHYPETLARVPSPLGEA